MTSVATALIKGGGKFEVFSFEDKGDKFVITAKQSRSECTSGKVSIYIKANNEKTQRIGFYIDTHSTDDLLAYVKEELLEY